MIALTQSGRRLDLAQPQQSCIDIADVAEHLAKLTPSPAYRPFYSYAQRACVLAEFAMTETDAAETVVDALLYYAPIAYMTGASPSYRVTVFAQPEETWATLALAIHARFGRRWPHPQSQAMAQRHARLVLTELKTLQMGAEREIAAIESNGIAPLKRAIRPWPMHEAAERYLKAWHTYAAAVPGMPQ